MSVTFVPDQGERPRVAYGVGRAVGPAAVRNRVRRRLRSAAHEVVREHGLPPGAYLVTVRPGVTGLDYPALRRALAEACREASGSSGPSEPSGSPPGSRS